MRLFSAAEENKVKELTELSVGMTYLEPTQTGLEKSIMDATAIVRSYLKDKGVHDYLQQAKGIENKIVIDGFILTETDTVKANVSLYRPETKNGDPRIWVSKLNHFAQSNDIVSLIIYKGVAYTFNLTQIDLSKVLSLKNSPLYELIQNLSKDESLVSSELLQKLIELVKIGPVETLVDADTGVGRTLEHLLGISMNSSKKPDYKGIELKSYRDSHRNRMNLFAQVPDWSLSKFKSSAEILNQFGYTRNSIFRLYCTVSAITKNSQGLSLRIDDIKNLLIETSDSSSVGDFAVWRIEQLKKRLLEKHKETFWIKAESQHSNGKEFFLYKEVLHTKKPIDSQLGPLLSQGIITLDHLIKQKGTGVVEKGPIFKIQPTSLQLLIPDPKYYDLIGLASRE